jgi:hypothetical protein
MEKYQYLRKGSWKACQTGVTSTPVSDDNDDGDYAIVVIVVILGMILGMTLGMVLGVL